MTAKVWSTTEIKEMLQTDDRAVERAVVAIWKRQTGEEQLSLTTKILNNIGFNAFDARLMSSFAEQISTGRTLSFKQMAIARKRMVKYVAQLASIANEGVVTDTVPAPVVSKPRIVTAPEEEDKVWNKATDGFSHGYFADMSELGGEGYIRMSELTGETVVRTHGNVWTELRRFEKQYDEGDVTQWSMTIANHKYTIFND